MTVVVNGEARQVPPGTTLRGLLDLLELDPDGVAVALNLEVVPRGQHAGRELSPDDRIELVRAVGGG